MMSLLKIPSHIDEVNCDGHISAFKVTFRPWATSTSLDFGNVAQSAYLDRNDGVDVRILCSNDILSKSLTFHGSFD
jgi:hypothetical protein